MVKKIFSILAWVVTGAALVALFIFARENYLDTPIRSVNVNIDRNADSGFVKKEVVLADINTLCATAKIGTVNMASISKQLKSNPWIESSSSFVDLDANLNVKLKEYEPVMRVFGTNGQSAYVTAEGMLLPVSRSHTPHVLIASGNFNLDSIQFNHKLCDSIEVERNILNAKYLLEAIERNIFMKNNVGQIYCNGRNEFEIVAKGIGSRIVIGDTCNIDDKLKRLEIFIEQKANSLEIKSFKTINLKYKNQIVCTKR
jgi:cell division protein FtsQ